MFPQIQDILQKLQHRTEPMTYITNSDVSEFGGQRKDTEEFDFAECWLQKLVVGRHTVVGDVVMAGNATQFRDLQINQSAC